MKSLIANASLLLVRLSSIAAEISFERLPLCGIAHSCGHSGEGATGDVCLVVSHHAWMSARVFW